MQSFRFFPLLISQGLYKNKNYEILTSRTKTEKRAPTTLSHATPVSKQYVADRRDPYTYRYYFDRRRLVSIT